MPCAGKTGTTNEQKDGWFVGYTRYYTTSVWVGYDMPQKLRGLAGSSYPGEIWKKFMEQAHEGRMPLDFLPYAQVSEEYTNTTFTDDETAEEENGEEDAALDEEHGDTDAVSPDEGNQNEGAIPEENGEGENVIPEENDMPDEETFTPENNAPEEGISEPGNE